MQAKIEAMLHGCLIPMVQTSLQPRKFIRSGEDLRDRARNIPSSVENMIIDRENPFPMVTRSRPHVRGFLSEPACIENASDL